MINNEALQTSSGKKALNKALLLLGKRSYTIKQIQQKLQKAGHSEEVIEAVINYCLDMGYLDDHEYVRQWVSIHNRLKPIGKRRILYELKAKGINQDIITTYLDDSLSDEREYQLAASLIKKKIGHNLEIDDKTLKKLYHFLLRRGFSHNISMKVICSLSMEN